MAVLDIDDDTLERQVKEGLAIIAKFQNDFRLWLTGNDWSITQLVSWLEDETLNYNKIVMPDIYSVGIRHFQNETSEPCHILSEGMKGTFDHSLRYAFYARMTALLADNPDVKKPGKQPQKVLFNLLSLCKNQPQPNYYRDLLFNIQKRGKQLGTYEWANLDILLFRAMMNNQTDQSLLATWKKMIETGNTDILPDNPNAAKRLGLKGILRLPEDPAHKGRRMEAIARALREHILDEQGNVQFSTLSYNYEVPEVCVNSGSFFRDLFVAAREQDWPAAALLQLGAQAEEESSSGGYGSYPDFTT
jgi:hypothetical protein